MGEIATLGRSGHTVVKWDETLPKTVDEARVKFDGMLKSGFAAFETIAEGPAVQTREFHPTAERIVMVPATQGG